MTLYCKKKKKNTRIPANNWYLGNMSPILKSWDNTHKKCLLNSRHKLIKKDSWTMSLNARAAAIIPQPPPYSSTTKTLIFATGDQYMMDLPLKIAGAVVLLRAKRIDQSHASEQQRTPASTSLCVGGIRHWSSEVIWSSLSFAWSSLSFAPIPLLAFSSPHDGWSPLICLSTQVVTSDHALCSQISPPISL